jgi:iron(III) transport system ATP-binding protein
MNVLEVRSVSKRYGGGGSYAVHDVSLTVARGEVLAVVGESGSGKTTLLRLIAGLEVPTSGEVVLGGRVASSPAGCAPPEQRGIGLVFQDYALFPHLTVQDNVMFGLHTLSRGRRAERATQALDLVGLREYGRRYPHELSGGQQQRVALARALAPQPSLLLLDEPFSNLDVVLRAQVREEVGQILAAVGTTALFVVHDLDDVLSIADRVAILKHGRLQQIDTPEAVYARPADEYVARLFGTTNLLPGIPRGQGFDTPIGFIPSTAATGCTAPVTLSIHPADLEIAPGTLELGAGVAAVDRAGAVATVRQTRFRGDHQEVVLMVVTPAGRAHELLLHTAADRAPLAGQVVRVRAPRPEAVRLLG